MTSLELGKSFEGNPIKGLKISKQKGNTGVFIEAGIHAREWISPAAATYIINELISSNCLFENNNFCTSSIIVEIFWHRKVAKNICF